MKPGPCLLIGIAFAYSLLIPCVGAQAPITALVGGTIVNTDGTAPVKNAVILMEGSIIKDVGGPASVSIPEHAELIHAEGKWIIPGLVDAHVHFNQSGGLYARPDMINLTKRKPYDEEVSWIKDNLLDTFARYLKSGVTSVVDVGGPFWTFSAVRDLARRTEMAPRVAVAGPLISTWVPEEFRHLPREEQPFIQITNTEEARELVREIAQHNPDLIKIWFIPDSSRRTSACRTPEDCRHLIGAVTDESHKLGFRVGVHALDSNTARVAVDAGADILVHSVTFERVDKEFAQLLKQHTPRPVLYVTTLMVPEGYAETFLREVKLTAPEQEIANPYVISTLFDLQKLFAQGPLPERLMSKATLEFWRTFNYDIPERNLKLLQDEGVTIALGTDAGNIGTPHGPAIFREFELMKRAGLSPAEILKAATINGAKVMGREKELGTIQEGKLADVVILNKDPLLDIRNTSDIFAVIKGGKLFWPKEILNNSQMSTPATDQRKGAPELPLGDPLVGTRLQ